MGAAGGHHPLRAMHRCTRQHGHPGSIREVSNACGLRALKAGAARARNPLHRLFPQQVEVDRRRGQSGHGEARRPGAGHDGRAPRASRRRAQDRQCRPRHVVQESDWSGRGHARAPHLAPPGTDQEHRREQDRARPDASHPAGPLDRFLAPGHPPRPAALRGANAKMRRLPAGESVPRRRQDLEHGGDPQVSETLLRCLI